VFGAHVEQSHGGHVTPSFEGYAAGFQAGADAYETMWDNGMRGRAGVFVGWAEAHGDIRGFVLGDLQGSAGDAQLEATSMGAYGTLLGPGGWYLDSILMTSFYSGSGRSTGIGVDSDAWSLLGSLEAGIPFRLGGGFTLEPQAQLVYQHLAFDGTADPFSTVRFNTPDAVSGRIGVRLQGAFAGGQVRPYLKASLWQDWLDKDSVIYADTHRLDTEHGGTAVEVGGGLVAELMPGVGLWGVVDYTTDIAGDTERETLRGNAGVRITW
jgi:autotransporter family porin